MCEGGKLPVCATNAVRVTLTLARISLTILVACDSHRKAFAVASSPRHTQVVRAEGENRR